MSMRCDKLNGEETGDQLRILDNCSLKVGSLHSFPGGGWIQQVGCPATLGINPTNPHHPKAANATTSAKPPSTY